MDFILNGKHVSLETNAFDITVLDFLRELEMTGVTREDGSPRGETGVPYVKGGGQR